MAGKGTRNNMDWIRFHVRFAIYYRDDFDCVYCQSEFPIDQLGYGLTLDHVEPNDDNRPANLATCCRDCNSAKKKLSLREFALKLCQDADDVEMAAAALVARVRAQLTKPINRNMGLQLAQIRRPRYRAGNYVKHNVPGGGRIPMRSFPDAAE